MEIPSVVPDVIPTAAIFSITSTRAQNGNLSECALKSLGLQPPSKLLVARSNRAGVANNFNSLEGCLAHAVLTSVRRRVSTGFTTGSWPVSPF